MSCLGAERFRIEDLWVLIDSLQKYLGISAPPAAKRPGKDFEFEDYSETTDSLNITDDTASVDGLDAVDNERRTAENGGGEEDSFFEGTERENCDGKGADNEEEIRDSDGKGGEEDMFDEEVDCNGKSADDEEEIRNGGGKCGEEDVFDEEINSDGKSADNEEEIRNGGGKDGEEDMFDEEIHSDGKSADDEEEILNGDGKSADDGEEIRNVDGKSADDGEEIRNVDDEGADDGGKDGEENKFDEETNSAGEGAVSEDEIQTAEIKGEEDTYVDKIETINGDGKERGTTENTGGLCDEGRHDNKKMKAIFTKYVMNITTP